MKTVHLVGGCRFGAVMNVWGAASEIVAQLGREQHGVVAAAQLLEAGLTVEKIRGMRRRGQLISLARGVYAIGYVSDEPWAAEVAALLSLRTGGALARRSAATLWNLMPRADGHPIEIVVDTRTRRPRLGAKVLRARTLTRADVRRHRGVPATTPARTLLDLATTLPARELERAYDGALIRRLVRPAEIVAALDRFPRRRGASVLRALVAGEQRDTTRTRSELEEVLLALIRRADLPEPAVNARVSRWEVDFLWRAHGLALEMDGWSFHRTRRGFEADRAKGNALVALGLVVTRGTWRQVEADPLRLIAALAQALARLDPASRERDTSAAVPRG